MLDGMYVCAYTQPWRSDGILARLSPSRRKHGVDFADAGTVLHDEQAITISDEGSHEEARFVTLGMAHWADVSTRVRDEEAVRL